MQPGDVVFTNPLHPHRGPKQPFPPRDGRPQKKQKERDAGKRKSVSPARLAPEGATSQGATSQHARHMLFLSFVSREPASSATSTSVKKTAEGYAIFAKPPDTLKVKGQYWKDAWGFDQ